MILTVLTLSTESYADSLKDAFDSIKNSAATIDPGVYKSKTRTSVTGGGFKTRFPTTSLNLFSYTPPRISAGCNGIDAHFGGFSFINGLDFQKLVENITQNALGLVIHLAIKVGCEPCQTVLETIQEWANMAAALSIDSCMAAKSLVEGAVSASELCGMSVSKDGTQGASSDASEAKKKCSDEIMSWDTYQSQLGFREDGTPETKTQTPQCEIEVNRSWCILTALKQIPVDANNKPETMTSLAGNEDELRRRGSAELIMNMMPNSLIGIDPDTDQLLAEMKVTTDNKTYITSLYGFMTCGITAPAASTGITHKTEVNKMLDDLCRDTWDKSGSFKISVCSDGAEEFCDELDTPTILVWAESRKFFDSAGLYQIVADTLIDAFKRIRSGSKLQQSHKNIIMAAPIPLYQLLNLSATYPEIYDYILKPATLLLADMIVNEYMQEHLQRMTNSATAKNLQQKDIIQIKRTIAMFSDQITEGALAEYSSSKSSNKRAFENSLLISIKQYQTLMVNDVAESQIGSNINAMQRLGVQ